MTENETQDMDHTHRYQIIDHLVDEINEVGNKVIKDLLNNPDLMADNSDDVYRLALRMMSVEFDPRLPI